MKITNISPQQKNTNRVNIFVDGSYRLSLDIFQITDLGIRVGGEYSENELLKIESESLFGKVYGRALEYSLSRPHSAKEIRDYLWKKTRSTKRLIKPTEKQIAQGIYQSKVIEKPGIPQEIADRVFDRLTEKGYVDDYKFTEFWVENRNLSKGISMRKISNELRAKGVEVSIIDEILSQSLRNDDDELAKIIAKKYKKYDKQKLIEYLMRQGFRFDMVKSAVEDYEESID